jgi:hypothetical protein
MSAAKMETAAEKYRRLRSEKSKRDILHDVECLDCTMTWKARRIGIDFWVTAGILPLHLVETMLASTKGGTISAEDALKTMATKEVLQSIEFSAKVVKHTAAEPRIVETVTDPNDISQEEVLTCCFKVLLKWQMGGAEAERLSNFP